MRNGLWRRGAIVACVCLSWAAARGGTNNECSSNGAGVFLHPDGIHTFNISGGQVAGAGATLFADFFLQPSQTNDWIDVDNDGQAGFFAAFPFVDQLAPNFTPNTNLSAHWIFQYRSVGSVNGYNEFVENQTCGAKMFTIPADNCQFNQFVYGSGGTQSWAGPFANPSGTPLTPCEIEFSFLDVPSVWGTQVPGSPDWERHPADPGYGLNPVPSSTGFISNLQTLSRDCGTCSGDGRPCTKNEHCNGTCNNLGVRWCMVDSQCTGGQTCEGESVCVPAATSAVTSLNQNFGTPDEDTIYDVFAAWVPVAYVANRGTGLQNITYTDAQYAFLTGRMPNGENLTVATRSVGSGTRNAIMSSTGLDTSWGRGDNVGNENATTANFNLGSGTQRSNAEGSSQIEQGVQMHRLAFGYTGLAGSSRAIGDFNAGRMEILNLCKDVDGSDPDALPDCDCTNAANFVRPGIHTVLDNCDSCTGYTIGGRGSYVFRGNPNANRDPMDPFYNATDPALDNQEVANYINNIVDSVRSFNGSAFAGECFHSETCSIKQCSGAPAMTACTGTGQGTCPAGQTCNFINCVQDSDCSAISAGDCTSPRLCNNDTPCTTRGCSITGNACTVPTEAIDCPPYVQTCNGGFCEITNTVCIDDTDCLPAVAQTCAPDVCKSKLNMPGQFLANTFFLPNSIDCSQAEFDGTAFSPNPLLSQAVQDFVRANNGLGVGGDTAAFGSKNIAGLVPVRNSLGGGGKYSDGSSTGSYTYWDGAAYVINFAANQRLSKRNQVTADFNEDFTRSSADADEFVNAVYGPRAWQQSARGIGNGTTAFDKGQQTLDNGIPEVMGDLNGDGNLDKEDLRYFADGLALVSGQLDRKQGAIAVDTALESRGKEYPWADQRQTLTVPPATQPNEPTFLDPKNVNACLSPFLATGKFYQIGDFRGDVAGGRTQTCVSGRCSATGYVCTVDANCPVTAPTAGAEPMGWDGFVDEKDIDYCGTVSIHGNWSDVSEAILGDLSCDMDGDLDVDLGDLTELVEGILKTHIGDVDLDGDRDAVDQAVVTASIGGPNPCIATATCGWSDGDTNWDGIVDAADAAVFATFAPSTGGEITCPAAVVGSESTRAITVALSTGATAGLSAIRVRLVDLQNPVPANPPCCPPQNFAAYESGTCTAVGEGGGCARWVGAPIRVLEAQDNSALGSYVTARLQCSPYYADWSSFGVINIAGPEIMPSSTYEVQVFNPSCKGDEVNCTDVSGIATGTTRRSGDVALPFAPSGTQPDPSDVVAVLNKFRNQPGAPSKVIAQIQPNVLDLFVDTGALDIVGTIDAFRGTAYPFTGPCPCPSSVTCNATACTSAAQCSGGGTCVKTCNGGPNDGLVCKDDKGCRYCSGGIFDGLPCTTDANCPGGTCPAVGVCGGGFCRDRCQRCAP